MKRIILGLILILAAGSADAAIGIKSSAITGSKCIILNGIVIDIPLGADRRFGIEQEVGHRDQTLRQVIRYDHEYPNAGGLYVGHRLYFTNGRKAVYSIIGGLRDKPISHTVADANMGVVFSPLRFTVGMAFYWRNN